MASFLVELDEKEMARLNDALDTQGGQRIIIMRELCRAYSEAVKNNGALSLPLEVSSAPKDRISEKPKARYGKRGHTQK